MSRPLAAWEIALPTITLFSLLGLSVYLFGDSSSQGANQIALCLSAAVAGLMGWRAGISWSELQAAIFKGISVALGAILILFLVGMLIGSWILAGTVPTMIYFGLQLLDPSWFYAAACLVCALVSVSIGSSWTTAGTIGIGLIGTAAGLGLSVEITAGAIISGAYFGDKMSPLSDTTNLAPAVVGADLFSHIRNMVWTTTPSIIIALVLFLVMGLSAETPAADTQMEAMLSLLQANFNINLWLLVPLLAVFVLAYKKVPAIISIFLGALLGAVFAVVFQADAVLKFAGAESMPVALGLFKGVWMAFADGYVATTGNEQIDSLLSRGGMSSMLTTIWLIISAMVMGAVIERVGILEALIAAILRFATSVGGLFMSTILTCIGTNIVTADQYIAIVLPGRMFRMEFAKRGLSPLNLSRTLEDSATITSPLIPWNTCGAYMAGTLGVATLAYLPYCFFNLINPVISAIYGYSQFRIVPITEEERRALEQEAPATVDRELASH
ncbi:Na+/H+ antiporter NhaC [Simiduia aestuariiviva]|uniref:NhaC family Na+:H+ antiporter n=1 Tax=Simiduia aestuariiviva TaxID=1510459 RepID=A0A839UKZ3_9GAMM|nr:Na+/H+ antiporter NhaC [Simiduia aestuariiviva]MBB3168814.1 NhaC family Na+:H+ antiporter [Simiduia aestuariiviva]